jgi:CTP synthase
MKGNELERRDERGNLGGTMRLGAYQAKLAAGTKVRAVYGTDTISERHRHRYEVNTTYKKQLEDAGVIFCGMSPDGKLPEIIELKDHPWFVGVQFHPELKSKPFDPHPLFTAFIKAAVEKNRLV